MSRLEDIMHRLFLFRSKKSTLKGFRKVTPTTRPGKKQGGDVDKSERTCSIHLKDDHSSVVSRSDSNDERLSSSWSSDSTRTRNVRFLDEERGPAPRRLITEVNYRPRTADEDKRALYWTSRDRDRCKKEHLYDLLEEEIRALQEGRRVDDDRISSLVRRVERYCRPVANNEKEVTFISNP